MPDALIVVLFVILGGALVGTVIMTVNSLKLLRAQVAGLEKEVGELKGRIVEQESTIHALESKLSSIMSQLASVSSKPAYQATELMEFIDTARSKGILPAVLTVGTKLLKSYLQKRRTQSTRQALN